MEDAFLFTDIRIPANDRFKTLNNNYKILPVKEMQSVLYDYLKDKQNQFHIGFDPSSTTCAVLDILNTLITRSCKVFELNINPVKKLKAIKNDSELSYMHSCFKKADKVFESVINWTKNSIINDKVVSEVDIRDKIIETFRKYGANRLSFEPICSIGSNTAIVHHTNADEKRILTPGDIVLIEDIYRKRT